MHYVRTGSGTPKDAGRINMEEETCEYCDGVGWLANETEDEPCPVCGGTGYLPGCDDADFGPLEVAEFEIMSQKNVD